MTGWHNLCDLWWPPRFGPQVVSVWPPQLKHKSLGPGVSLVMALLLPRGLAGQEGHSDSC